MLYREYWKEVNKVVDYVMDTQADGIEKAARLVAESLKKDGMLYVFGCGHSHIIGEDLFYRAGGTAAVCAMLDSDLMLHMGAAKSSVYEKMSGLAQPVFERYGITEKDVLLVVSTSGINSVPVEMAMCAKERNVPVIAIVSESYKDDTSRHPSGKKLRDVADIVLDNGVCHGDAAVEIAGSDMKVGPISTISSCLIAQSIVVQADEWMHQEGVRPPVYVSGNIPGGMEKNQDLIRRYMPRNKHL
jgi:uncharacterized phosphosugar-binding protein